MTITNVVHGLAWINFVYKQLFRLTFASKTIPIIFEHCTQKTYNTLATWLFGLRTRYLFSDQNWSLIILLRDLPLLKTFRRGYLVLDSYLGAMSTNSWIEPRFAFIGMLGTTVMSVGAQTIVTMHLDQVKERNALYKEIFQLQGQNLPPLKKYSWQKACKEVCKVGLPEDVANYGITLLATGFGWIITGIYTLSYASKIMTLKNSDDFEAQNKTIEASDIGKDLKGKNLSELKSHKQQLEQAHIVKSGDSDNKGHDQIESLHKRHAQPKKAATNEGKLPSAHIISQEPTKELMYYLKDVVVCKGFLDPITAHTDRLKEAQSRRR